MSGSTTISPTRRTSRTLGAPAAQDVGSWKGLVRGRVLHSDWRRMGADDLVATPLNSQDAVASVCDEDIHVLTLTRDARAALRARDDVRRFVAMLLA